MKNTIMCGQMFFTSSTKRRQSHLSRRVVLEQEPVPEVSPKSAHGLVSGLALVAKIKDSGMMGQTVLIDASEH